MTAVVVVGVVVVAVALHSAVIGAYHCTGDSVGCSD